MKRVSWLAMGLGVFLVTWGVLCLHGWDLTGLVYVIAGGCMPALSLMEAME